MSRRLSLVLDARSAMRWLRARDANLSAARRAARAAIAMPVLFGVAAYGLHAPDAATFAAFGSFAMLLLADFGGTLRDRLTAQAGLVALGAVFVPLGTLASGSLWTALPAIAVVGFGVLFARGGELGAGLGHHVGADEFHPSGHAPR